LILRWCLLLLLLLLLLRLDIAMAEQGNINIYEIYADVCSKGDSSSSSVNAAGGQQQQQGAKYYGALLGQANPFKTGGVGDAVDACGYGRATLLSAQGVGC
jgi:hypothetical protein